MRGKQVKGDYYPIQGGLKVRIPAKKGKMVKKGALKFAKQILPFIIIIIPCILNNPNPRLTEDCICSTIPLCKFRCRRQLV